MPNAFGDSPNDIGHRTIRPEDLAAIQRQPYLPTFELKQPPDPSTTQKTMFVINEVGTKFESNPRKNPYTAVKTGAPGTGDVPLPPMTAPLASLCGAKLNLVFGIEEHEHKVRLSLGSYSQNTLVKSTGSTLLRVFRGQLAPMRATRVDLDSLPTPLSRSGLALGIPSYHGLKEDGTGNTVDKLIRSMAGQLWRYRIFAVPLAPGYTHDLRLRILEVLRQAQSATSAAGAVSRLAAIYFELLDSHLKDLALGLSLGMWRVAIYLEGTDTSYSDLAALWSGLFSGADSSHAPMSAYENAIVGKWNRDWILPDEPGKIFLHPFAYQTLLNSAQLAAIVDFPSLETTGFAIRKAARFDVAQSRGTLAPDESLTIGQIDDLGVQRATYEIPINALKRHAFVTGVTGAGKTNTLFQLLRQLDSRKIPFLVLEPAKNEYRALVNDQQLSGRIRVYTVGDERTTPLRMNPFEVIGWPTIPIGVHIDLVRSSFAASFGMWTPLPQILEQCLHEIYKDRGWDTVSNTNSRLPADADPAAAFPTMADLSRKVDEYTGTLGYDDRVRADLRAALLTRVNGLRVGGKGAMFDCTHSTPMAELLDHPVILELQNLGDDDDKAFFMALLFMRLVEYRRAAGGSAGGLRHLLVIEEAHRLLSNVSPKGGGQQEQADPKGKAVETFANLISEIRAYGQGLAIIDQVPTKLSTDVIKNTNLKIVHRIVAEDDRAVLAGAMAMNDEQRSAMAILGVGKAILFEEGEDAPLLVTIPKAKDAPEDRIPSDSELRKLMESMPGNGFDQSRMQFYPSCKMSCITGGLECRQASEAADEPLIRRTFAKLTVSLMNDSNARERVWKDMEAAVLLKRPKLSNRKESWSCLLTHLSIRLADRWGSRMEWSLPQTSSFGELLWHAVADGNLKDNSRAINHFVMEGGQMVAESLIRCAACELSAETFGDKSPCIGRLAVEDLVDEEVFKSVFIEADQQDSAENDPVSSRTWTVCNSAAFELVEFPSSGLSEADQQKVGTLARRCLLCFGFQMLAGQYSRSPWVVNERFNKLVLNHLHSENRVELFEHSAKTTK